MRCDTRSLLLRDRDAEPLATLGAAALEHQPAILGVHANQKPVDPPTTTAIWLIRALHWTPGGVAKHPDETTILPKAQKGCQCGRFGTLSENGPETREFSTTVEETVEIRAFLVVARLNACKA